MSHLRTCSFGMLVLSVLLAACTTFNPTEQPTATAVSVATRISSPTLAPLPTSTAEPVATASPTSVRVSARYGTIRLESVEGSGVSGTFTARDNGDGTTLLNVQLNKAADSNPWEIFALDNCGIPVPENQRSTIDLPDIENGRKDETVETAAYGNYPGSLIVVVYGMGANGIQRPVACANLGPPAGGDAAQATPPATGDCNTPNAQSTPAPLEGTWLAFSASQNNNADIYIARVDDQGANPATVKRLTTHPAADFDPTWSPDGTRIAFRTRRDGNDEIYVMNADGSCQVNLTRDAVSDWSPAWSPDGARIAFARFFDNNRYTDVAVMNVDGSGLQRLTTASGEYPAWSPDGNRIAFASARDGNYEIYVMNADGANQTRLTNNPAYDMSPVWSPDGKRIAYDTQRDHFPPKEVGIGPEFEIHVMNADGSGDTQLTSNTEEDRFPAWTANARVAFTRNGALFVMNADGSNQVQLLASGSFPAWRPTPLPRTLPTPQTVTPTPAGAAQTSDQQQISAVLTAMRDAVLARDKARYLAYIDLSDPVFAVEQQRWADGWSQQEPVKNFDWRISNLVINAESASGDLTTEWSTVRNPDPRSATYPIHFTRDDGRMWRNAGEAWVTFPSDHFRVRALPSVVEVAKALLAHLPQVYAHVTSSLDYTPKPVMEIKLYDSSDTLVANTLLHLPAIHGWNEPGESLKLVAQPDDPLLQFGLAHEFTHFIEFELAGTKRSRMPWWLSEGLAVYVGSRFEPTYRTQARRDRVRTAALNGSLLDWNTISNFESTPPELYQQTYAQGYAFVQYVTERFGVAKRNAWLRAMSTEMNLEEATAKVFSETFDQLDREFWEYLEQR